ncbi:MAG: GNAT family N-acetyltransferase [Lachnospiraceae bacterium]|nr:GNAT family N-acetyltransferase [Lachnospiraceae bacterium]
MTVRKANVEDADKISRLEASAFPQEEAASLAAFQDRLRVYPDHFLVVEHDGEILCCVNGLVTDEKDLTDEMYASADLHDKNGKWQMIFGVATHPDHRRQGLASDMVRRFVGQAEKEGRLGVVLTCKEYLVHFYERLGFVNEGVSGSAHGGVTWYQMRLTFTRQKN